MRIINQLSQQHWPRRWRKNLQDPVHLSMRPIVGAQILIYVSGSDDVDVRVHDEHNSNVKNIMWSLVHVLFSNMNANVSQKKMLNRHATDYTKINKIFTTSEFVNDLLSTVGRVLGSGETPGDLKSKVWSLVWIDCVRKNICKFWQFWGILRIW